MPPTIYHMPFHATYHLPPTFFPFTLACGKPLRVYVLLKIMSAIRLILLLVVLGSLTLLLVYNWSPVSLAFLGIRTQPLPLAIWILFSLVAGAVTSLFITGCFKLSNYFAQPKPKRRRQTAASSPPRSEAQRSSTANYTAASSSYTPASDSSQPKTDSTSNDDNFNDWESGASDDWDFQEDKADTEKTPKSVTQDPARDYTNYEANTEPKSGNRSGSVYSYNYRQPSNSGVGRTESIYDADYRVLTPPYKQTDKSENDDDWGFEDDEDWEDENKKDPPQQGR